MALTFSDIAPIDSLNSQTYSTTLKDDWCIGAVPNGGYISSIFLLIARHHMTLNHVSRNQPHAVTLHLEFLRRTSASVNAIFSVQEVKLGSRISNLHIILSQKNGLDGAARENVMGYVTMSNISSEQGPSLPTFFTLHPTPPPVNLPRLLADALDDHWTLQPPHAFPKFRKAARHIRVYLPRLDKYPRTQKPYLDQWVRFHPEGRNGRWTNDCLGFVVDMFPQIVEEYLHVGQDQQEVGTGAGAGAEFSSAPSAAVQLMPKARYWYPTLVLNLDVKKALPEPEGTEWLFVRVGAKVIRNGRMDLDILVLDEHGDVVATSTHAGLIMGTERNVAGRQTSPPPPPDVADKEEEEEEEKEKGGAQSRKKRNRENKM